MIPSINVSTVCNDACTILTRSDYLVILERLPLPLCLGVENALSLKLYNELLPYSPETTVISRYEITYTVSVPFHELFLRSPSLYMVLVLTRRYVLYLFPLDHHGVLISAIHVCNLSVALFSLSL